MTYVILIEKEVVEHLNGSINKPPKEEAKALVMYMKGEVRAQRILIESMKVHLISSIAYLGTSKEINDNLC